MLSPESISRLSGTLPPEFWQRIEELYLAALEHAPETRLAWLAQACPDNDALRGEVESLLLADGQAGDFLERRASEQFSVSLPKLFPGFGLGHQIGPYRLVREIGQGGMGAVYLAERTDGQFKQQVALKLIKRGMDTDAIVRRFHYERQILASLNHPNIARLLDGGATEDGRPYFAMEFIEGEPLLDHCDRRKLDTTARLKLFREVCAAVQHAHNNSVIHRDIKPSNILVTADERVKLLDFGIAKLLKAEEAGLSAQLDQRPMTPEYASPEQTRGWNLTTASDVYALGVVLYELLTGHRPYRINREAGENFKDVICNQEPERPSVIVMRTEESRTPTGEVVTRTPESVSQTREGQPDKLRRCLRGDLDNIVLKALRKEPESRYQSPAQLAGDIERHLEGMPIFARPNTPGYRAAKFVRRNKIGVTVAAGFTILAFVAAVLFIWQAARTARERDKAEQVAQFLINLFQASGPEISRGDKLTVREVLDRGADKLDAELQSQPEVQAKLFHTIGSVYHSIGVYSRAAELHKRALETRERLYGRGNVETAESIVGYVMAQSQIGMDKQVVERMYREALQTQQEKLGADHPSVAATLQNLGMAIWWGNRDPLGAEPIFRQALEIRRRRLGDVAPEVAESLGAVAGVLPTRNEHKEAEALAREALAINLRLYPEDDFRVGQTKHYLAILMHGQGRYEEAEKLFGEALLVTRKTWPEGHAYVGNAMLWLGQTKMKLGKLAEAEALFRESLDVKRKIFSPDHGEVIHLESLIGTCLLERGQYAEAEPVLKRNFLKMRDTHGMTDWSVWQADRWLRNLYFFWNKQEKLKAYYELYADSAREFLAKRRQQHGEDHIKVGEVKHLLATALYDKGDYASAEQMAEEAQAIAEKHMPGGAGTTIFLLGKIKLKREGPETAEPLLRQGLDLIHKTSATDKWLIADADSEFGAFLLTQRRYAEAEPLLTASYQQLKSKFGERDHDTQRARERLVQLYRAWGKPQQAAEYRTRR